MDAECATLVQSCAASPPAARGLLHCSHCSKRIQGKQLLDKRKTDGGYAHRKCILPAAPSIERGQNRGTLSPGEATPRQHATRGTSATTASTTATATAASTQQEDTSWNPTPEELASWKPNPQLAAAIAAQEAEWVNRTPAQWARRHYLQHVAPRCEQCNFPRTGKKGWDEQKQCHTDKYCNTNRWRVLDAFC